MVVTPVTKMRSWFLFAIVCVVLCSAKRAAHIPLLLQRSPIYTRITNVGLCPDNPHEIVTARNLTISYAGTKVVFNGIAFIYKDFDLKKVDLKIRRCNSQAEEKNCEHFQTWTFGGKEACVLGFQEHMIWSGFLRSFTPELKCPISKNTYHINNATVDASAVQNVFSDFPIDKYFWRGRIDIYQVEPMTLATCLEIGLYYVRGRPIKNH